MRSTCGLKPMSSIPVGLVEDERLDAVELIKRRSVRSVSRRRRDQDLRTPCALGLRAERRAAVDRGDAKTARLRERLERLGHLGRELARRNE